MLKTDERPKGSHAILRVNDWSDGIRTSMNRRAFVRIRELFRAVVCTYRPGTAGVILRVTGGIGAGIALIAGLEMIMD